MLKFIKLPTLMTQVGFNSWKLKFQNLPIICLKNGCFSLNIKNLFSFLNIKILQKCKKKNGWILVQISLIVGRFLTIEKITQKSALMSLTMYTVVNCGLSINLKIFSKYESTSFLFILLLFLIKNYSKYKLY